jgi:2-polyprenyl-6-methoxyphenol hydroxylase-like FAD-dependent oxidoreductase
VAVLHDGRVFVRPSAATIVAALGLDPRGERPTFDVAVVGGGPGGVAAAITLARAGRDVVLVDRARFPRDKACAEYLSPATADALARLGVLAAVEAKGPQRPLGMHLIGRSGSRALVRYPDGASSRRALCLSRRVLDATLLQHAREAGVRVLERAGRGVRLTDPALVLVDHADALLERAALAEALFIERLAG